MTKHDLDSMPPPEVMQALETLERANSAADLGPAYQTLLDWRRSHRLDVFGRNAALPFAALAIAGLFLLALQFIEIEINDYWRGFYNGVWFAWLFFVIGSWLDRRTRPPEPSIGERIEAAIDRWRHAVPAMREIPR